MVDFISDVDTLTEGEQAQLCFSYSGLLEKDVDINILVGQDSVSGQCTHIHIQLQ